MNTRLIGLVTVVFTAAVGLGLTAPPAALAHHGDGGGFGLGLGLGLLGGFLLAPDRTYVYPYPPYPYYAYPHPYPRPYVHRYYAPYPDWDNHYYYRHRDWDGGWGRDRWGHEGRGRGGWRR
jgi:hypothetical protein